MRRGTARPRPSAPRTDRPTRGSTGGIPRGGRRSAGGRRRNSASEHVEVVVGHVERDVRRRRFQECRRRGPCRRSSASSRPSAVSASSSTPRARRQRQAHALERSRACSALRRRGQVRCERAEGTTGSGPAMPASSTAQSSSVRAIGPAWSRLGRERDDAAQRDATARRLDRRRAAQRARDAQRAGGVGARRRRAPCARRAPRPSRRSSRRASARAPTDCRPGRSSRRRRTRACGGGRAGSCPARAGAPRRRSPADGRSSSRLLDAVSGRPATA